MGMDVTALPWDSNFFGLRMASMKPPSLDDASRRVFQMKLNEGDYQWVQCCVPHDGKQEQTKELLEKLGFEFVDTRVELRGSLDSVFVPDENVTVRRMLKEDISEMQFLHELFTQDSRFNYKDVIDPKLISSFYRTWVVNSDAGLHDDAAYVALVDGKIRGVVTVKTLPGSVLRMGIMGIDPESQGQGVGSTLTHFCKQLAKDQGCTSLEAITEGRNEATKQFHEKNGLAVHKVSDWYYYLTLELL